MCRILFDIITTLPPAPPNRIQYGKTEQAELGLEFLPPLGSFLATALQVCLQASCGASGADTQDAGIVELTIQAQ